MRITVVTKYRNVETIRVSNTLGYPLFRGKDRKEKYFVIFLQDLRWFSTYLNFSLLNTLQASRNFLDIFYWKITLDRIVSLPSTLFELFERYIRWTLYSSLFAGAEPIIIDMVPLSIQDILTIFLPKLSISLSNYHAHLQKSQTFPFNPSLSYNLRDAYISNYVFPLSFAFQ